MAATIKATENKLRKNISQTAKELDRLLPNWEYFIDTDELNMGSFDNCICGQLKWKTSSVDNKTFSELMSCDMSADHGFWLFSNHNKQVPRAYRGCTKENKIGRNFLKQVWVEEIESRLSA